MPVNEPFSEILEKWLRSDQKTLGNLISTFEEKSFAVSFLVLMFFPSLPLPTGGISHLTEAITMFLSVELIIGRKSIWLPKKWEKIDIGKHIPKRGVKTVIFWVKKAERISNRRLSQTLARRWVLSLFGIMTFLFSLAAFIAPPFSGLDTLPAMGVVVMSLGIVLEDVLVLGGGILVGLAGIGILVYTGLAIYRGLGYFFEKLLPHLI